jgi:ribonuclease Z
VPRAILAIAFLIVSFNAVAETQGKFLVTLLGTGNPRPSMDRFGPSVLVEVGREVLLFDVGRGSLQRLQQAGVSYSSLTGVFITHVNSDHVVGRPDLWVCGWGVWRRTTPLEVWGPAGTAEMVARLREAYRFDLQIRVEDDKAHPEGGRLVAIDIDEQIVLNRNDVKVTAFRVDHGPVKPAFGYRVDYQDHSVVLSGDTRKSENLVKHARGTDVLIHEVATASASELEQSPQARSVMAHHTSPREAAEIFREVAPKLAVYSHIGLRGAVTEGDIMKITRQTYGGAIAMGQDLMTIDVRTAKLTPWKRPAAN